MPSNVGQPRVDVEVSPRVDTTGFTDLDGQRLSGAASIGRRQHAVELDDSELPDHGELLTLGITVAPSTVWEILRDVGIDPARDRAAATWAALLRCQAEALPAIDFIETVTLTGARMYILAVIEHVLADGSSIVALEAVTGRPFSNVAPPTFVTTGKMPV